MHKQSCGRKRISHSLIFALALTVSAPALGGGLYISEFGQPGMGLSGAGWNVLAEDASTGIANAAGIFWLDDDSEWMVTGLYVTPSMKFRSEKAPRCPVSMAAMPVCLRLAALCSTRASFPISGH